jgi:hypothetical protein
MDVFDGAPDNREDVPRPFMEGEQIRAQPDEKFGTGDIKILQIVAMPDDLHRIEIEKRHLHLYFVTLAFLHVYPLSF